MKQPAQTSLVDERFACGLARRPSWKERGFWLVAAFAAILMLGRLNEGTLAGDPVRYALVSREIFEHGTPFSLTLDGKPYFNKPPLLFWLTALDYAVLGVSTFSACLWSALFGVGSCLALYALVRCYREQRLAAIAGIVLALSESFVKHSTRLRLDSAIVLFGLLAVREIVATRALSSWGALRLALWIGLAVLAKGPVVLMSVAVLVCVAARCAHRRELLGWRFAVACIGGLSAGVAWLLLQRALHGPRAIDVALGREVLNRVAGRGFAEREPWVYLEVLLHDYWPWLPFAFVGAWVLARARRVSDRNLRWCVVAMLVCYFVPVAFLPRKWPWYLMPLWPALAVVSAYGIEQVFRRQLARRWYAFGAAGAVALGLFMLCTPRDRHPDRAGWLRQFQPALALTATTGNQIPVLGAYESNDRTQIAFYLRRSVRSVASLDELCAAPEPVAIVEKEWLAGARARGWRSVSNNERLTTLVREGRVAEPPPPATVAPECEGPPVDESY